MRCDTCGAGVDRIWRWCPECGSNSLVDPGIDLTAAPPDDFVVDWFVEGGSSVPGPPPRRDLENA